MGTNGERSPCPTCGTMLLTSGRAISLCRPHPMAHLTSEQCEYLDRDAIEHGEYDVPIDDIRTVLDIGANIGHFATWAMRRWPGCKVKCYEPHPGTYLRGKEREPKAEWWEMAINDGTARSLHISVLSTQHSLSRDVDPQMLTGDEVAVYCVPAKVLPDADLVKVDTEGEEVTILRDYFLDGPRSTARAVVYEWHRINDYWQLGALLSGLGFRLHAERFAGMQVPARAGVAAFGQARWVR